MPSALFDVSTEEFPSRVIERSHEIPVLVDFWAEWCGPCRMLGPVLEKLAHELQGVFELVKINTDTSQEIAAQYRIQGIPAVKLFVGGQVVAEFVGAQPESQVRDFLKKHCPSEADKLYKEGLAQLQQGQKADARARFARAIEVQEQHSAAHLELARLALEAGEVEEVKAHLDQIPSLADEADEAKSLREALVFAEECKAAGGETGCTKTLAENPDDLDAMFAMGACLAASGKYEEALKQFLAVVDKDRRHRDEAARKAMLTVFGIVGIRTDLANQYRRKLAIYL